MDPKKAQNEELEYKVEAGVDKRTIPCNGGCNGIIGCDCEGRVEYRIKWLGWGPESNTWEPLEHLYCDDLIEDFEKSFSKDSKKEIKVKHNIQKSFETNKRIKRRVSFDKRESTVTQKTAIHATKRRKSYLDIPEKQNHSHSNDTQTKKDDQFKKPKVPPMENCASKSKVQNRRRSDGSQIDANLDPEKIIGAADSGGELMFLIKWKGIYYVTRSYAKLREATRTLIINF